MRKHTVNTILAAVAADYSVDNRRKIAMNEFAQDVGRWAEKQLEFISPMPRQVFEWSTSHKWDDVDEARKRITELGESASIDLCNGYRWIGQMMDWVATHMQINMSVCFKCADHATKVYGSLPVCEKCFKLVNPERPVKKEEIREVQDRIAAVFAQAAKPRPSHREVCSNRKIRHSFVIKTPTGFVMYDGTTVPEMHLADKWTRHEVEIERAVFDDLGTPLSIFRVVKP